MKRVRECRDYRGGYTRQLLQNISTWLRCHREALEAFGGVPQKVVIDGLKAGIIKALWHDQGIQRSYLDLAEHYGFMISPCRPRTPEHKGKVESGVHVLELRSSEVEAGDKEH